MQDLLVTQATNLPTHPARPSHSGVRRNGWVPFIGPFVCQEQNRWVFRPLPQLSARQPPQKNAVPYAKTEKGAGVRKRFDSPEPPAHHIPSSCRPKLYVTALLPAEFASHSGLILGTVLRDNGSGR